MIDIKDIQVKSDTTIKETLKVIDKFALKIAVVIDNEGKVIGTITDGDIRRAFLNGYSIDDSIINIYFKTPTLGHINDSQEIIIQKAIVKKLYQIPIVDDQRRLIKIEDLALLLKIKEKRNKVIIMAGGLGTRLRPLTNETPKPLLNVGDKPILQTIIENFSKFGFTNFILCVNYKAQMIKNYFKDGNEFGVKIEYIEENKQLGTAGALSLIKDKPDEPFFVINGDILTNVNFSHLLDFHINENAIGSMCVREYDYQVPYGVIKVKGSNITAISEKPIHKFFVNAGIYVLSPKIFDYVPKDSFFDMPTLFDILIKNKLEVVSFPIHEYWLDIGRISDFEKAQNEYYHEFEK